MINPIVDSIISRATLVALCEFHYLKSHLGGSVDSIILRATLVAPSGRQLCVMMELQLQGPWLILKQSKLYLSVVAHW